MSYTIKLMSIFLLWSVSASTCEFEIIYSNGFNFNLDRKIRYLDYFPGKDYQQIIEKIHTSGTGAFGQSFRRLFYDVSALDFSLLKGVHSDEYRRLLRNLYKYKRGESKVPAEEVIRFLNNADFGSMRAHAEDDENMLFELAQEVVRAQALGTAGTVLAMQKAAVTGVKPIAAINLSGGYHHARYDQPSGFCLINDVAVAVNEYLTNYPQNKVLIIDLDAHRGDGNENLFRNEDRVAIFDIFNKENFPHSVPDRRKHFHRFGIDSDTGDLAYHTLLSEKLAVVLNQEKPDLVVYNAGTDVYEHDPIGNLSISGDGIVRRDEIVFELVFKQDPNARIVMVMSGGYATGDHLKEGAEDVFSIIGRSIVNLKMRFGKIVVFPSRANFVLPDKPKRTRTMTATERFLRVDKIKQKATTRVKRNGSKTGTKKNQRSRSPIKKSVTRKKIRKLAYDSMQT